MGFDWYLNMVEKAEQSQKWHEIQNLINNTAPFLGAQLKIISAIYFDKQEFKKDILKYYKDTVYRDRKQKIKNYYESQQELNQILEVYKKPKVNMAILPVYSFFLQFSFTLAQPYISKDDDPFYLHDNPVKKDKVFKVPMVSGSTWKGNMRWAARQLKGHELSESDKKMIAHLFGNEKSEKEIFFRGRLNFYPTFFDDIGLEVINPHKRDTKAGTQPIPIESVPEGAKGTFNLLYVPFDLIGRREEDIKEKIEMDVDLILQAFDAMMLKYGFSAKKTTGYGVIKNEIAGTLEFKKKIVMEPVVFDKEPFDSVCLKVKEALQFDRRHNESA